MNNLGMRATLALGLLALAGVPAHAERYSVEPVVDPVATQSADQEGFSQAELDQILAPIALYPDALLSQVLIAATYPLEIVEAARWSRQNPDLQGEDAVAAVADRDWDPSVKALVAFPELLAQMDEDLDWTRALGDAMLFQEEQVMDSIQFLRARADAAGNLETNEYVRVIREEETIIIEPVQTRVVHVPYYNPHVVYGTWWRPAYPPVFWPAPAYYYYGHPGFYWSSGVHIHSGFFFSSFYWPQRHVVIVHTPRFHHPHRHHKARHHFTPGKRWTHDPRHRRGVAYRHRDVNQRFDQPRLRAGPATRWPLESGTARTGDRSRDGSRQFSGTRDRQWDRSDERNWEGRTRDSTRTERSGTGWRDHSAASGDTDGTRQWRDRSASRDAGETRLSAGPRTVRPNVTETRERLRSASEHTGANVRPQQRTTSPPPRATASNERSASPSRATVPTQRSASPLRATASSQRSASPPQATSRAPARAQSRPGATAAPAPAPRASSRASARGTETRAAPGAQRDRRGSRRDAPGRRHD